MDNTSQAVGPRPDQQRDDVLPISTLPVQMENEVQQSAAVSELESSWAGVLHFTQSSPVASATSIVSAASTGVGSDWHVLNAGNDECASSTRSFAESADSLVSPQASALQSPHAAGNISGASSQNEAIADHLLQSHHYEMLAAAAAAAADAPEGLVSGMELEGLVMDPTAALLDIDSFDAVIAQGPITSEGSVDGYSEASTPASPRSHTTAPFDQELEIQVEVPEPLLGAWGMLAQLAEKLQGSFQQMQEWVTSNWGQLHASLHKGATAVVGMEALLPTALRQAAVKLRTDLKANRTNWTVIMLSSSVAVLGAALLAAWTTNTKMSRQMRQKDRELARLVVKIFNLQEALQNPRHAPIIRHTNLPSFSVHPMF